MKFFVWGFLAVATGGFAKTTIAVRPDPPTKIIEQPFAPRGHWVMSEEGHAVYCVGPTVQIGGLDGQFKKYATKCLGPKEVVPLHD